MSPPSLAQLDATAVENFREYLRIPSVQPDIDYGKPPRGSPGPARPAASSRTGRGRGSRLRTPGEFADARGCVACQCRRVANGVARRRASALQRIAVARDYVAASSSLSSGRRGIFSVFFSLSLSLSLSKITFHRAISLGSGKSEVASETRRATRYNAVLRDITRFVGVFVVAGGARCSRFRGTTGRFAGRFRRDRGEERGSVVKRGTTRFAASPSSWEVHVVLSFEERHDVSPGDLAGIGEERDDCVAFLHKQAQSLDLPIKVYHVHPRKPIVVLTWLGTEPSLPAILLNSHMDVVPVFADKWTYPPFSAHMDEEGNIYARGSQDMKCVGIQYLEAVRRMKSNGERFKRTIHISFVPDEEIGGVLGMKDFVHTADFRSLNVGFAMDEGVASPTENFYMFYGERSIWHVHVKCSGNPGHGSLMLDNTAGEKLRVVIDRFMDFRATEKEKLKNPLYQLGDVTSVNLTQVKGGVQTNVIPNELTAVFDLRLPPTVDHTEFENTIKGWCNEAGEGVTYTFEQKNSKIESTKLDPSNPFWIAFKNTCDSLNMTLDIGIFPGGTDSRFLRQIGIPALCFSPMNKTKILLHDHDEYLNKDIFLHGIQIYMKLIPAVANV